MYNYSPINNSNIIIYYYIKWEIVIIKGRRNEAKNKTNENKTSLAPIVINAYTVVNNYVHTFFLVLTGEETTRSTLYYHEVFYLSFCVPIIEII